MTKVNEEGKLLTTMIMKPRMQKWPIRAQNNSSYTIKDIITNISSSSKYLIGQENMQQWRTEKLDTTKPTVSWIATRFSLNWFLNSSDVEMYGSKYWFLISFASWIFYKRVNTVDSFWAFSWILPLFVSNDERQSVGCRCYNKLLGWIGLLVVFVVGLVARRCETTNQRCILKI